jgi:hypothetical protein
VAGVAEQHADGGSTAGHPVLVTITLIPFTSGAVGQSLRVADAKYPPPCAPRTLGPMLISAAQSRMICAGPIRPLVDVPTASP